MRLHRHILSYCFLFPLFHRIYIDRQSSTTGRPFCLTSMVGETIQEHSVRHSHPTALGFQDSQHHCLALRQIYCLPPSHLCSYLDYPSPHSSQANFWWLKCFQVHNPDHFGLNVGECCWFGGHLILVFVLQGGSLQIQLVAQVMFLTIWMQLHHQVGSLSRTL